MAAYTVNVPEEKLVQLKNKLSLATFPDELDDAGWEYGAPLADVKRLAGYWKDTFDWRAQEKKLNQLPQFHRGIKLDNFDELDIHYVYQPSDSSDAIPLLFCHGWPGSYLEVSKLLASLKQSANGVSFHVVAPSLPNFGWSQGTKQKGFGLREYAETCHRLMLSLGYNKYVTQAGDWGFYITRTIGLLHPEACLASHINFIRANPPTFKSNPIVALQHALQPYSQQDIDGIKRSKWYLEESAGYRSLQCSKPQTIGYALHDSPVALLAWILEKLYDWTDNYPWTDDEILLWVSIYYLSTAGPAASLRIYYEAVHPTNGGVSRDRTSEWIGQVKLGLLHAPREVTIVPSTWAWTLGPVVFESRKTRGGHFLAHENPEAIIEDLREMFGKGGPCYQIIGQKANL